MPIDFPTVAAAYEALKADPTAEFKEEDGWIVVTSKEGENTALWSFTPPDHPAHPAVAKRGTIWFNGNLILDMRLMCLAERKDCDALYEDFVALNNEAKDFARKE